MTNSPTLRQGASRYPFIPGGEWQSIKAYVRGFLDEYPDLQVEVEDLVVEGQQAAARLVWHGHRRGTGELFHQMGIVMLRLDDEGRFVERWSAYKSLE